MEILFIIAIIILIAENSKIKKENVSLKERIKILTNTISIYNERQYKNSTNEEKVSSINNIDSKENNSIDLPKPSIDNKNAAISTTLNINEPIPKQVINKPISPKHTSVLFVLGSILIILASLVFLASSWDLMSGLTKTFILCLFQLFFVYLSNTCLKKYSLDIASKVFNYLSLIFIQIIIISLSFFDLLGEYFSLYGDGFYLYLTISFVLTSIIYKYIAHKKDDTLLNRTSVVLEILSIIFLSIFLEFEFKTFLFILSIYNILILFLLYGNYLSPKSYKLINDILTGIILFLLTMQISTDNLLNSINFIMYSAYFILKLIHHKNPKETLPNLVLTLYCYTFSLNIINVIIGKIETIYLLIALLPLFILYKFIDKENSNNLLIGINIISIFITISTIFITSENLLLILSFAVLMLINILTYIFNKMHIFKYLMYFNFILLMFSISYVYDINNLIKYIPLSVALLSYIIESIFNTLKDKYSNNFIMVCTTLTSLMLINSYYSLLPLIFITFFITVRKENQLFLFIPILVSLSIINIEDPIVPVLFAYLSSISLTIISLIKKKQNIFSFLSLIAIIDTFLTLKYNLYFLFITILIWSTLHLIYNKEENKLYKVTTIIGALGLYEYILYDFAVDFSSVYALGYLISLIITTNYVIDEFKEVKFLEYYVFGLISIITLIFYNSEFDGLLYVIFLVLISLVSYAMKYKSYLKVSGIFIILNILALTAKYWLLLPWYIYILLIGCIFLVLAIYDEKRKNSKK